MNPGPSILCARFALLAALGAAFVHAQSPAGELRLEVRDSSGAPMQASGMLGDRGFQTDAQGLYTFQGLPYGRYRLELSQSGFATQVVEIDVASATPVSRIVTMALANAASTVDVVAATPLAGTDLTPDQIAGPVQTATAADIENSGALDLARFHEPAAEWRVSQRNAGRTLSSRM